MRVYIHVASQCLAFATGMFEVGSGRNKTRERGAVGVT